MFELDGVSLHWFGHASFMIETSGKTIYIDPYILPDDPKKADLILVTHEHFDHCAVENIMKIANSALIITTEGAAKKCNLNTKVVKEGDSVDLGWVNVKAVPAYNLNKPFHPRGLGVGFIIEINDKKIYHAGDTDFIPEMKELKGIDLALLPIGGTYTMDIDDAVNAVKAFSPRIVIPMHYNSLEGLERDPNEFKEKVESQTNSKVVILSPEA